MVTMKYSPVGQAHSQCRGNVPGEGDILTPLFVCHGRGAPGCYLVLIRDAQLWGLQRVVPGDEAVNTVGLWMGKVRVRENDGNRGRAWGRQRQRETDSKAVDTVGLRMRRVRVRENDGDRGRRGCGGDRDRKTDNKAVDTASLRMGKVRVKENDGG